MRQLPARIHQPDAAGTTPHPMDFIHRCPLGATHRLGYDMRMTELLPLSDQSIANAAGILRGGGLVAFPTETVYGLGADACHANAVASIFTAKNRPKFNPLISHVATVDAAFALGSKTPIAAALAAVFWPGPMTLVLTREDHCPIARLTSAGLDKIALRVPAHAEAQRLLTAFGGPVAAPSANMSGKISPSRATHVMQSLAGRIDLVLDGGACESGVESTIVDCTGAQAIILRPGGVTRDEIIRVLAAANLDPDIGNPPAPDSDSAPVSPGQLASHYAPNAALRLNVKTAAADEILVGFGTIAGSGDQPLSLSATGDLSEAAAKLFDLLHQLDAMKLPKIAIAPIPETGLGEAINDRLRRAAAPR